MKATMEGKTGTFVYKWGMSEIKSPSLLSLSDRTVALCVWVVDCPKVLFLMLFWQCCSLSVVTRVPVRLLSEVYEC